MVKEKKKIYIPFLYIKLVNKIFEFEFIVCLDCLSLSLFFLFSDFYFSLFTTCFVSYKKYNNIPDHRGLGDFF